MNVQLEGITVDRIRKIKSHYRETHNQTINRLIDFYEANYKKGPIELIPANDVKKPSDKIKID